MATQVDERIVSMKFDNADFEKRSRQTLKSLHDLDVATNNMNGAKGLQGLAKAAKEVDLSHLDKQLSSVQVKFSALQVVAITTLQRITNAAITTGKNLTKSLTIQPVTTGFNEYELKMGSIQTIMAGTGESIETVNKYLEELNEYSDRTIYSFSDMTQNIGKFTNAGVKLDKAVAAIKGVSNVAAVSGANANEASRAMYNFAQALSAGHVKLMDWKSIELANMATVEFKNQLLDTAIGLGTVTKTADGMYKTLKGNVFSATKNFNEVLSDQWLTTDVLVQTLSNYADETTEIGKKAYASAQDVKTFTMLLDTLREAAQSGWAQSYELIFGNFEEAKTLWTSVNEVISGIISKSADERNNILKEWKELGGRTELLGSLGSAWKTLASFITPVRDAIQDIFPPMTGKRLYEITKSFRDFVMSLQLSEESAYTLRVAIKTLLLPFKATIEIAKLGVVIFASLLKAIWNFADYLLSMPSKVGSFGEALRNVFGDERYLSMAESMNKIIDGISNTFTNLRKSISEAFRSLTGKGASDTFSFITKFKTVLNPLVGLLGDGLVVALNVISSFSLSSLIDNVKILSTGITDGIGSAIDTIKDFVKMIASPIDTSGLEKVAGGLTKVSGVITNDLDTTSVFDKISKGSALLKDILGELGEALVDVVGRLSPYKIILLGLGVGIVSVVFSMSNALSAITSTISKIGSVFSGFASIMTAIKRKVSVDKVRNVATAILILAGALVAISTIPSDKILSSVGALSALVGLMLGMTVAVTLLNNKLAGGKLGETMKKFGVSMTGMAAGLLLISYALKVLAGIDVWSIVKSFVTLVATMVTLVLTLDAMSGLELKSAKAALSITLIAGALGLIVTAISKLAQGDFSGIEKNIGVLVLAIGSLIALAGAVRLAGGASKAFSLLIVIMSYVTLVNALRLLANMNVEKVYTGLLQFIPIFGVLATLALVSRIAGAKKSGMNIFAMATSIVILSKAIRILGEISMETLTRGALIAGGLVLILGIAGRIMVIGDKMKVGRAAGQFVAMGIAIAALSLAIKHFGSMDDKNLEKGTVVVSVLIVLLGLLVRMTAYASKSTLAILSLTGMLGILLVALAMLTAIPSNELYPAAIALSGVLVAFAVSLRILSKMAAQITKSMPAVILIGVIIGALAYALSKFKSIEGVKEAVPLIAALTLVVIAIGEVCNHMKSLRFRKYLPTVALMAGFVAAIGLALSTLNLIKPEGVMFKATALSEVMLAIGTTIGIISKFGSTKAIANCKGIIAEVATLLVGATGAVAILSVLPNPETIITKATALSEILISLGIAVRIISSFGSLNVIVTCRSIIIEMASLLVGATAALAILSVLPNPESMIQKATALSILLIGLSTSVDILGMFRGSLPAAIGASLALGVLILALGGVVAAFGALGQIPGFQEFVTNGVETFGAVGTAIGLFVGNLVSGLVTGVTTGWLTALAAELAAFADGFASFTDTIMEVDDGVFAKCDQVTSMVNSFSSVNTKDGKELIKFGESLPDFANDLKRYFNRLSKIDNMSTGNAITRSISDLIAAFPEDMSKFNTDSLDNFGDALASFGEGVIDYYDSIKGATFDQTKIDASVAAGQAVAKLANSLPGTGGWLQTILGDKDIGLFGQRLSSFGVGVLAYWNTIKAAEIDTGIIDNVTESAKKIVNMLKDLPATGGWLQDILGEKDYSGFVTNMPLIGGALIDFYNSITVFKNGGRAGRVNKTVIANACESLSTIIKTLQELPNTGGLLGDIFGNKDLSGFATGLSQLGGGVKDFADAIGGSDAGSATSTALETINSFVDMLGQLRMAIEGAESGIKEDIKSLMEVARDTIKEYKHDFFDAGQSLMEGLINGVKSKRLYLEQAMQKMADSAINATTTELDEHSPSKVFAKIGENVVLGFCNGVRDNQYIADDRMVKMGEGVLNAIKTDLGIHSPSTVARDEVGRYIVQGVAEGITSDTSAEEAAKRKAESIVNAFKETFDRIKLIEESIDLDQQLYEAIHPDAYGEEALNQAMGTLQKRLELQAEQVQTQEAAYKALVQSGYATQEQVLEQENKWKQEQTKMYELSKQLLDAQEQTQGTAADRMVAYAQYIAESKDDLLALGFTMEQIQKAAAEKTGYMMDSAAESAQIQFKTVQDVFDYYVKEAEVIVKEPIVEAMTSGIGGAISAGSQAVAASNVANGELIGSSLIDGVTNAITNGDMSGITEAVKQQFIGSGTYVWEGIVDGASAGLEKASDIGAMLWNKVNGGFQEEGEIASPSKVMYQNGVWLVEGLVNGINDSAPLAYNAMANLVNGSAANYSNAGIGLVDGMNNGITNSEANTLGAMTDFFKKAIAQVDSNQPNFYDAGNNLTKKLCDGMTDGFTSYFDAVTNAVISALTTLETEVKMKAASIAQSVSQALSQAAQIGISGSMVPVVNAGENQGSSRVGVASTKIPAYKKNYTKTLASATRQMMTGVTGSGAVGSIVRTAAGTAIGTVINNFTQNNTSPKALSRTEIYRDSKNLFSRATGSNSNTRGGKK